MWSSQLKKNEIIPLAATWMDLEIIILNEVKSERERQIPYDITYMWNLNYDINQFIYKIEMDSQAQRTDLWLPKGRGGGEVIYWEFRTNRCKLQYYI